MKHSRCSKPPSQKPWRKVELGGWAAAARALAISGLGALNGWTLVIGAVTQTMAHHGGFPPSLARENSRGAPARAFIVTGIVTSVMLLFNYVGSVAGVFMSMAATILTLPLYWPIRSRF